MLIEIRELTNDLKLKELIISSSIPNEDIMMLEQSALYNRDAEEWTIPNI